jgi:hypothetical protein
MGFPSVAYGFGFQTLKQALREHYADKNRYGCIVDFP